MTTATQQSTRRKDLTGLLGQVGRSGGEFAADQGSLNADPPAPPDEAAFLQHELDQELADRELSDSQVEVDTDLRELEALDLAIEQARSRMAEDLLNDRWFRIEGAPTPTGRWPNNMEDQGMARNEYLDRFGSRSVRGL